jgi:acetylserotonin O-methyltransferase
MTTSADTVLDLIQAFRRSKTMFAAVALGVFDRLEQAPAGASAFEADERGIADLLNACVGLGLLERHGELYRNSSAASRYLVRDSPDTLAGYILYSNSVLYRLWDNLEFAVREGTHQWQRTFGSEGPIFAHFFRTEEAMREFLRGMHGMGRLSSPSVVRAFDLSRFRRLVDLGSATGHLPIAACEAYPDLRAVAFDLPRVAEIARGQVSSSGVASRIEVIAGDLFEDDLPHADLYSLGQILHDWPEARIHAVLRKVFHALPAGGALLVCERILDEDRCGPVAGQMQSLNMLVCTEGRERTLREYTQLLETAGFSQIASRRTGTPLDAILAVKAGKEE